MKERKPGEEKALRLTNKRIHKAGKKQKISAIGRTSKARTDERGLKTLEREKGVKLIWCKLKAGKQGKTEKISAAARNLGIERWGGGKRRSRKNRRGTRREKNSCVSRQDRRGVANGAVRRAETDL